MDKNILFAKILVLVFCFLSFTLPSKKAIAQDSDQFIYVLILDKTGSMMGRGDGLGDTIWFDVQAYLEAFVDMIGLNNKVIVYTFHGSIDPPKEFNVNSTLAKQELRTSLRNIVPNGQNTAIYVALDQALNDLQQKYPDNPMLIYLITDGKDNASPRPQYSFAENLRKFSAIRGEFDHLYYIDLRGRADSIDKGLAVRDSVVDILQGFARPIEIRTLHNPIPVGIEGGKARFVQDFEVRGFELPDDFVFNARLQVVPNANVNLSLLPSLNITKTQLERIETGRYRLSLELELLAGTIEESLAIPVRLSAPNISAVKTGSVDMSEFSWTGASPGSIYKYETNFEYIINFNPDSFILNIELNVPRLTTPQGGWRRL